MKLDLQPDKNRCFICKCIKPLQCHHVIEGSNRSASDTYGLMIWVCADCHTLSPTAIHRDGSLNRQLKRWAQKKAMEFYGWTLNDWFERFTFSYLTEDEHNELKTEELKDEQT